MKDRGLFATGASVRPFRVVKAVQSEQPPRSKRGDLAMLRLGLDIALEYFNSDGSVPISSLTTKARLWADRYFKGYPYAAKRPTALLRTFPNLFNLNIERTRFSTYELGPLLTTLQPIFDWYQRSCPRRPLPSPRALALENSAALSGKP